MANWIDLLLMAIILISAAAGWRRGFILGAMDLLGWAVTLVISFAIFPYVSSGLGRIFPSLGVWRPVLSFLLAFLVIRSLFSAFTSLVLRGVPRQAHYSLVNKTLGVLPGFVNGLITAAIVALVLTTIPLSDQFSDETRDSKMAEKLTQPVAWVEDRLSPVLDSVVNKTTGLNVEPGSNETVDLHYTTERFRPRPDLEAKMLALVNEERTKQGLKPLEADTALAGVARAHSADMFSRGYFSHYTPEGKDPFERMRAAHIRFLAAGENLALAPTLNLAHTGLMHSPGHRANILSPAFGRLGIGVLDGGLHGLMISQEFRN